MVKLKINLEVENKGIEVKLYALTVEEEAKINPEVWYSPKSVGRLDISPFEVTIRNPIRVKQYPVSQEGREGLQPVIERLLQQGLLETCMSPHNTPILPIEKPDGSYRLVQDLREVNYNQISCSS